MRGENILEQAAYPGFSVNLATGAFLQVDCISGPPCLGGVASSCAVDVRHLSTGFLPDFLACRSWSGLVRRNFPVLSVSS